MASTPRTAALALIGLTALLALTACGVDSDDEAGDAAGRGDCLDDRDCPATDTCFDGRCIFQGDPDAPPVDGPPDPGVDPDRPEDEPAFAAPRRPVATRGHVWITSPATDSLVRVDAATLRVELAPLGDAPGPIEALPDRDAVIVLATGDDALYRVGPTLADVDVWRLDHHHNALALSPDGRYALTWFDLDRAAPGEDAAALQTVSVLDLDTGALTGVAVGYRPRQIVFTPDRALVVTRDGISTLDLDTPTAGPAPLVPIARDLIGGPDRETAIDPTGQWAVSRDPAEPGITLTHLTDGALTYVDLGGTPTDLDLLPDGRALVMLRAERRLALVPLATAADPDTHRVVALDRAPLGVALGAAAVAPDGRRALLYTTLDPPGAPSTIALLDPPSGAVVYLPLRKPARAAAIDPDGRVAIIRHPPDPDAPDTLGQRPGYSLVDLDRGFVKLETTAGEPSDLVFHGDLALLALTAPAALATVDLATFAARTRPLPSTPEAIGMLPAIDRAFVTQTHPTGQISFVPLTGDGPLQTVTGFALNGRIE